LCEDFTESMAREKDDIREVSSPASLVEPIVEEDQLPCAQGVVVAKPTDVVDIEAGVAVIENLVDEPEDSVDEPRDLVVEPEDLAVEPDDLVVEPDDDEGDSDNGIVDVCETGYLMLRSPCLRRPRPVPNCCAICIAPYEKDEEVVWSSNRLCKHAFHLDCIMDWLIKSFDGTPCPCCRQDFTDLVLYRQEKKIIWQPGNAFNPSVIVFRPSTQP
jgi:Ring finger domain